MKNLFLNLFDFLLCFLWFYLTWRRWESEGILYRRPLSLLENDILAFTKCISYSWFQHLLNVFPLPDFSIYWMRFLFSKIWFLLLYMKSDDSFVRRTPLHLQKLLISWNSFHFFASRGKFLIIWPLDSLPELQSQLRRIQNFCFEFLINNNNNNIDHKNNIDHNNFTISLTIILIITIAIFNNGIIHMSQWLTIILISVLEYDFLLGLKSGIFESLFQRRMRRLYLPLA